MSPEAAAHAAKVPPAAVAMSDAPGKGAEQQKAGAKVASGSREFLLLLPLGCGSP